MPHCTVEYTDNMTEDAAIPELLEKIAAKFRSSNGIFPTGGLRVRAIRLSEYVIADGKNPEDAFLHITTKIGPGRDLAFRKQFFGELFEEILQHLQPVIDRRPLAISMYIEESDETGSFKFNTIHHRLKKQAETHATV